LSMINCKTTSQILIKLNYVSVFGRNYGKLPLQSQESQFALEH